MKNRNKGFRGFMGAMIFLAVFAAAAAVVMLLWNWLIPSVIGWGAIGYWQSAGLLLLCKLLFGGMGRFGHGHCRQGHRGSHPHFSHEEKERMREAVRNMTNDERREYIRKQMFGNMPGGPEKPGSEQC